MAGIEKMAVSISFFNPLNYRTNLSKRIALNILNSFPIPKPLSLVTKSIIDMQTIMKSNWFQVTLKYERGLKATIFRMASVTKTTEIAKFI
jgi:CubicO group peptidase (beta-lactamase class C family)